MSSVVGLFDTHEAADRAINALRDYGIEKSRISVIARGDKNVEPAGVNAGTGAAAGAATGGMVGLLAGLGALLVPGIGPVIAAGALATAVGATAVGAGVGAAAGGIIGALVDTGVSPEDAEFYTEGVKRGGVLVSVDAAAENTEQVAEILRSAGSVEIESRRQSWQDDGWTKFDPTGPIDREIDQR